jgi:hypothetical protein
MRNSISGLWKLKSYSRRFLDTGEVLNNMLPSAYILYTPGGHMMSLTVEAGRQNPAGPILTDEECLRLFKSIVSAYAGTYTIEGAQVTHSVEVSWNEAWTGTQQVRQFSVEGDTLRIVTTPRTSGLDSREFINTLTWERVEALFPRNDRL